jgi:hypothetical protein
MTDTVEFHSRVGQDGVLDLHIPLGNAEAGADVVVTIRRAPGNGAVTHGGLTDWHDFVETTYGSCAGFGVERQPQGGFDKREAIE